MKNDGFADAALRTANALLETKVAELQERNEAITLLGRMSDALQSAREPSDAYVQIGEFGAELFRDEAGALAIVDPVTTRLHVVAGWRNPTIEPEFAMHECRALRGSTVHASGDRAGNGAGTCGHSPSIVGVTQTCTPITTDREVLGIICFDWRATDSSDVDPFQLALARAFANQVCLALTNLRLKALLRSQAMHDPLTGLHNRRYLEEAFHRELLRAERRGSGVGVLMLDIDHFKEFNDAHGHVSGDALLRAFATRLRREIRAEDIACRYGGEEFTVIIPNADLKLAHARAEQIRLAMQQVTIELGGSMLGGLTVSVGVAARPDHGSSPDALLRAADAALYMAKTRGRDRTESAGGRALGLADQCSSQEASS